MTEEELPEDRKAMAENSIAQYVKQYHTVAAERDEVVKENTKLKVDVELANVSLVGKEAVIADLESRMQSAYLERDRAVADREKYYSICRSLRAVLNEFEVDAQPFIKETPSETPAIVDRTDELKHDLYRIRTPMPHVPGGEG